MEKLNHLNSFRVLDTVALSVYNRVMSKDLKSMVCIGSGSHAEVYDAGEHVVKITDDYDDALISQIRFEHTEQIDHLVKTIRVFKLSQSVGRFNYAIINEKVKDCNTPEFKRFLWDYQFVLTQISKMDLTVDEFIHEIDSNVSNSCLKHFLCEHGIVTLKERWVPQLAKMFYEAQTLGMRQVDISPDNIFINGNNRLVCIDLGHMTVSEDTERRTIKIIEV